MKHKQLLMAIMLTAFSLTACDDSTKTQKPQFNAQVDKNSNHTTKQNVPLSALQQIKQKLPMAMDIHGTMLSDIKANTDNQIILIYSGKIDFSEKLKGQFVKTHGICEMFSDDLMRGVNLIVDYSGSNQQKGVIAINHYDCTHEFNTIMAKNLSPQVLDNRYEQVYQDVVRQQTIANAKARAAAEEAKYQAQQSYQQQQELYNQIQQQQIEQQSNHNPPSYGSSSQNNSAMSDYCSKPVAGARGMTAKQAQICFGGGSGGSYDSSYSAPAQSTPSVVTNCDGAGCWWSNGTRYNSAGGDNYYSSDGRFCQNIGGQMQCH